MFGKDKIENAVHCTDLPEDGLIEVSVIVFLSPTIDLQLLWNPDRQVFFFDFL